MSAPEGTFAEDASSHHDVGPAPRLEIVCTPEGHSDWASACGEEGVTSVSVQNGKRAKWEEWLASPLIGMSLVAPAPSDRAGARRERACAWMEWVTQSRRVAKSRKINKIAGRAWGRARKEEPS